MPEGVGYGQPPVMAGQPAQRTLEQDVPFLERLKRLLPSLLGGRPGDIRMPFQVGEERDPRLSLPSQFEQIQQGLEQVRDLGRPKSPEEDALLSIQRMAGGLRKP